jgi:hypothetical protein
MYKLTPVSSNEDLWIGSCGMVAPVLGNVYESLAPCTYRFAILKTRISRSDAFGYRINLVWSVTCTALLPGLGTFVSVKISQKYALDGENLVTLADVSNGCPAGFDRKKAQLPHTV